MVRQVGDPTATLAMSKGQPTTNQQAVMDDHDEEEMMDEIIETDPDEE